MTIQTVRLDPEAVRAREAYEAEREHLTSVQRTRRIRAERRQARLASFSGSMRKRDVEPAEE